MNITRRRLLELGSIGLAGSLAGCNGNNSPSTSSPSPTPSSTSGTPTPPPTETETETPTPTPTIEPDTPALASTTRNIFDSVIWHSTQHGQVMGQVRIHANRVLSIARSMEEATRVTANDVDELRARTEDLATYMAANVEPYYPVDSRVLNGNNVLVQQVGVTARRGDRSALDESLGRLRAFYTNYSDREYFETNFSNSPIYNKLAERLGGDNIYAIHHPRTDFHEVSHSDRQQNNFREDGVEQHVHEWPTGHQLLAHAHTHSGTHTIRNHNQEPDDRLIYAYRDGGVDILADDNLEVQEMEQYRLEREDVFESVSLPTARQDALYLIVNNIGTQFLQLPALVQRFSTIQRARRAVATLLDADVFEQGTTSVGGREWRRVFYTQQGVTFYAYLIQTGEFVVTAAPDEREWRNQTNWPGPISSSWLGSSDPGLSDDE